MITQNYKKIFICATEQSGDNIGSGIIKELLNINPNLKFDGVGGNKMKGLLDLQFYSINHFKTMGFFEIFFSLNKYIKMILFLSKKILANKYDLIITIDSPDFNYPLIKSIRKKKNYIKVVHIVAPTVWAWREYRAKKFANIFDEIFVLFKFEEKYFNRYNLKTTYIGHPIYYINTNKNFYPNDNYIAFLPGSRLGELNSLFIFFKIAYEQILNNKYNIKIFIPTLPHLEKQIRCKVKNWKISTVITTDIELINEYYQKTKFALVCSGTASLEVAKRHIPQLIIYKFNFFTVLLIKKFIKVKYANIINIIEGKMIIPELTNSNLKTNIFKTKFNELLTNKESNISQISNIKKILDKMDIDSPPYKIAAERLINLF